MLSAAREHVACHTQAEKEDVLARTTHLACCSHPTRGKVPVHPPAAAAAAEAEMPVLLWDDEDGWQICGIAMTTLIHGTGGTQ